MAGRRGYTLIEVLAVVVVCGLLACAAAFRLWEPLRVATAEDVCEQVRTLDRVARSRARQSSGSVKVVYVIGSNLAYRSEEGHSESVLKLHLPAGWTFDQGWIAGRISNTGRLEIPLSADGTGDSYALRLVGRDGPAKWLVFAALGGDSVRVDDDGQAKKMLDALASTGADTP